MALEGLEYDVQDPVGVQVEVADQRLDHLQNVGQGHSWEVLHGKT